MRTITEPFISFNSVTQISKKQSLSLARKGDVLLVRSDYAYEKYGDHFSLIVGGKIKKERGLRPNLVTLPPTDYYKNFLDTFDPTPDGAIILLLDSDAKDKVLSAYGLHLSEGELSSL